MLHPTLWARAGPAPSRGGYRTSPLHWGHLLSPAPWAMPNSIWAKLRMMCEVPVPGRVPGAGWILTTSCRFKLGWDVPAVSQWCPSEAVELGECTHLCPGQPQMYPYAQVQGTPCHAVFGTSFWLRCVSISVTGKASW